MNGVKRYFSDVNQQRHYRTTVPQEGAYSQTVYADPGLPPSGGFEQVSQVVEPPGAGPWWARGVTVDPAAQRAQIYGTNQRVVETTQLNPADIELYERYLHRPPSDVVVEGDRTRKSNGKPRKMDYSGQWRAVGQPYQYSEQTAYVQPRRPVGYVTEEMGYAPYGYQEVMMPPPSQVSRQVITERMAAPIEQRIVNTRVY